MSLVVNMSLSTSARKISEKQARALCLATQRGTVPRLGRFLLVTLEDGSLARVERVGVHRYVLHKHPP